MHKGETYLYFAIASVASFLVVDRTVGMPKYVFGGHVERRERISLCMYIRVLKTMSHFHIDLKTFSYARETSSE